MEGHLSQNESERTKKEVLLFSFMLGKNGPSFFINFYIGSYNTLYGNDWLALFMCDLFLWMWWHFNSQRIGWLTSMGVACVNPLCITGRMGFYLLNFSRLSLYTCNIVSEKFCKCVLCKSEHLEVRMLAHKYETWKYYWISNRYNFKQWMHTCWSNLRKRTT